VRKTLHVLNGDSTRMSLEQSSVRGTFLVYPDVLHDGPVALTWGEDWRKMRTQFIAAGGFADEAEVLRNYRARDAALARFGDYDEVVFWFEHDLFDQLLLIRHLHWLSHISDRQETAFSLICIGEFPGVPDFAGLGQLSPEQLASLLDGRRPITAAQIRTGARAWEAFCSPHPEHVAPFAASPSQELPFLAGALHRHLEDFPSTRDGLSRSETQILRAIEDGPKSPDTAFRTAAGMEERIFMGDWTFWGIVERLAKCTTPLLDLHVHARHGRLPSGTMRLTQTGESVLAGRDDFVRLNGLDRWMGGVHLTTARHWRWNGTRLVSVDC
jgi:Domain of unknown function (DUF1835)